MIQRAERVLSRARLSVILFRADWLTTRNGVSRAKESSRFLEVLDGVVSCRSGEEIQQWVQDADWARLSTA